MILEENPIPSLVNRHRKLKWRQSALDAQIDDIRGKIRAAVEATGEKWTDRDGYAKMVTKKESVSFSNADVNRLAITWSESTDPIMQACGKMLLDLRKEKAGYSYLQVK